ncbi:amylo-alpha-1,6-glucosidase [bacterium]|nr:amylo-alpha-1,6-glucosidase [bacterium]
MTAIRFGREITGDLKALESREWLVSNGLGSYSSGSVAGSITRGYHGLLVTALKPPIDRRIMLVKVDEQIEYLGQIYDLSTNRWASGATAPDGFNNLQSFELEGSIPLWRYACGDAIIEKRIWMAHGEHSTYIAYTVVTASAPLKITVRAIVDNRVFHNTGQVAWPIQTEAMENGVQVLSGGDDTRPLKLIMPGATATAANELYSGFFLPVEQSRGLNDQDTHAHAADFTAKLSAGESSLFLGTAESDPNFDPKALEARRKKDRALLKNWSQARVKPKATAPEWIKQLVLSADQFVVDRPSAEQPDGKSVIAGYHWFEDWGRDTMISLPGLTIVTGRLKDAAPILETFARYIDQGMLPNRFPDGTDTPEYNTIDATLWYFEAIREYVEHSTDHALLKNLYPKLEAIIEWHVKGTRYGIQLDPEDSLLRGGQEGVQLTWMDARVGDHVITPRMGKPIEVNALWYNALCSMVHFSKLLDLPSQEYERLAKATKAGFARFWNAEKNYCYDVLDGPNGNETELRPNQILAVSLPQSPLPAEQQKAVVEACSRTLLTSHGLRSLAPSEDAYVGCYAGDSYHRDSSYHQGTVWGWLIGPFISAHLRVYNQPAEALRILEPFGDHLSGAGIGMISEIFDADPPFTPRGCIAQAWSVAQVLYAYDQIERQRQSNS